MAFFRCTYHNLSFIESVFVTFNRSRRRSPINSYCDFLSLPDFLKCRCQSIGLLFTVQAKSTRVTHYISPSPLRDSRIIASCMNLLNIMTPCRNLCDKLSYPCFPSPSPYALGLRYCTKCEKYFQMNAIRCPCCNRRLRYRKKKQHRIICDICEQEAFIFQNEGSFCLNCWQDRTEPHIT